MRRALVGPPGPLWAPLSPCGHPWALVGRSIVGWALVDLPWALVGRALVGAPGPMWAGPLLAPLGPDGLNMAAPHDQA